MLGLFESNEWNWTDGFSLATNQSRVLVRHVDQTGEISWPYDTGAGVRSGMTIRLARFLGPTRFGAGVRSGKSIRSVSPPSALHAHQVASLASDADSITCDNNESCFSHLSPRLTEAQLHWREADRTGVWLNWELIPCLAAYSTRAKSRVLHCTCL